VSASAIALAGVGKDQWNASVYGSLSVASRIASAVRDRSRAFQVALLLRKQNKQLAEFLEGVHLRIEGKIPVEPSAEPLSHEKAENALRSLRELSAQLFGIYQEAKAKRLTNHSLLAGGLSRIRIYSEDIAELADWLEGALDPKAVEDVFERARKETEEGNIFDIERAF